MAGSVTTVFVYDIAGRLVAEYGNATPTSGGTSYLTADNLGTPRIITGLNGAVKARHDYMPFGEELYAGTGGRTGAGGQGYIADEVRQKFTSYERDGETGLDYAKARYFSSTHGRFTSVDPMLGSASPTNPQTWNRYSYTLNNPLRYTDPSGMVTDVGTKEDKEREEQERKKKQQGQEAVNPCYPSGSPGCDPIIKETVEVQDSSESPIEDSIFDIGIATTLVLRALPILTATGEAAAAPSVVAPAAAFFIGVIGWGFFDAIQNPRTTPYYNRDGMVSCTLGTQAFPVPMLMGNANDKRKMRKIAADTGLTVDQVGDALHQVKQGLFGDTNPDVIVDSGGDMTLPKSGDFIGNIRDYITGDSGQKGSTHGRGSRKKE